VEHGGQPGWVNRSIRFAISVICASDEAKRAMAAFFLEDGYFLMSGMAIHQQ
jgi:hypothetical protein